MVRHRSELSVLSSEQMLLESFQPKGDEDNNVTSSRINHWIYLGQRVLNPVSEILYFSISRLLEKMPRRIAQDARRHPLKKNISLLSIHSVNIIVN